MWMVHDIITDRTKDSTPDGTQSTSTHDNHVGFFAGGNVCDDVTWFHASLQPKLYLTSLKTVIQSSFFSKLQQLAFLGIFV